MGFPILMSPLWRPLLLPFGGTSQRSYAEPEMEAAERITAQVRRSRIDLTVAV